jgi:hypothetical protein
MSHGSGALTFIHCVEDGGKMKGDIDARMRRPIPAISQLHVQGDADDIILTYFSTTTTLTPDNGGTEKGGEMF